MLNTRNTEHLHGGENEQETPRTYSSKRDFAQTENRIASEQDAQLSIHHRAEENRI